MAGEKKSGTGLLMRLILGIFIPILLAFIIIGSMLFISVGSGNLQFTSLKDLGLNSVRELTAATVKESTTSLNNLGEKIIRQKAQDVAGQVEIFLRLKGLKKEDLSRSSALQEIAVQKVGETGYTALLDDQAFTYLHPDPKIAGADLHPLATRLPQFWKIIEASMRAPSSGYYDWKDPDGRIRPKYMHVAHVRGTNLRIAATTYIDEFSKPAMAIADRVNHIEKNYSGQYNRKFLLFSVIVIADLIILLAVIYLYSSSIVGPIRHLSQVADRISMGDLKATIDIKGKGEVVVLAESIERMQTSVKAAIERLQKRRDGANGSRRQASA